ncbi:MAG: LysM peptidoglycan-binding domain-containing protein [Clostridiales bacterium]|nr:LysM peptidoglycan-binding domain-containing protein [Clostridiales bacterium]
MDALSRKKGRRFVVHTVKAGENLSRIAAKYNTSVALIDKHNAIIKDPSHIEPGWKLDVPDDRPGHQKYAMYTVMPTDTLGKIAKAHLTTVEAIADANPSITNPNLIHPGSVFRVPDNR